MKILLTTHRWLRRQECDNPIALLDLAPLPGTVGFASAFRQGIITSKEINNDKIAYIDNNLTLGILQRARVAILKAAGRKNLCRRALKRMKHLLK